MGGDEAKVLAKGFAGKGNLRKALGSGISSFSFLEPAMEKGKKSWQNNISVG